MSALPAGAVLVLDGGLATELETDGFDLNHPLWSGQVLLRVPEAIGVVHRRFLEAGADCITSASYQLSFEGFRKLGLSETAASRALTASVDIARLERDRFWKCRAHRAGRRRPLVAASVGPYGAYLADGSEYHGHYAAGERELAAFHERRLRVLVAAGPDLLAVETIPSGREAKVLGGLLDSLEGAPPAWVSFSCRNGAQLADGTPVTEAAAGFRNRAGVFAVGVNCTAPRFAASLIGKIAKATGKPVVAYPNRGGSWDPERKVWEEPGAGTRTTDWDVAGWVRRGARLVGGCCRVGPADIRTMRRALPAPEHPGP